MEKELLKLIQIEAIAKSKEAFDVVKKQFKLEEEDFNAFRAGYLTGVISTSKSILDSDFD